MLDLKFIRKNPDKVREMLRNRNFSDSLNILDDLLKYDRDRRNLIPELEELRHRRNEVSKKVSLLRKEGIDASQLIEEQGNFREKIHQIEESIKLMRKESASFF